MSGSAAHRRIASRWLPAVLVLGALGAPLVAPCDYARQYREFPNAAPSRQFALGTDELGRDRLSRLLYGSRTSLLLAPAAALASVAAAALAGTAAALGGGVSRTLILGAADVTLSLPWLFLLLTVRALLPLDVTPAASVAITFAILGVVGWAGPARVVRRALGEILGSDYLRAARSRGVGGLSLLHHHVLPNLAPVLAAQFFTSLPVFILAEANLGMLGLGIAEPLPSWGSLLGELETQVSGWSELWTHAWLLAPLATLVATLAALGVWSRKEFEG